MVALCLLAGASGCTSHQIVRDGEVNRVALKNVQEKTSETRGLAFLDEVGVEAYTKEESGAWIAKRYSDEDSERNRLDDVVAHRLGFLPDGVSLSDLFRRTLTQNAAGIYRPKEKKLFIVTDILNVLPAVVRLPLGALNQLTGTDWNQEMVLSHELVHALQDQHFDLDRVLPGRVWGENEDMALARKSIVESEANIVSQAYTLSAPLDRPATRNLLITYLALFNDLNVLFTKWTTPGLPAFYAKLFVEQYTQGMRFIQAATNRGGWETLNRAYRTALPRSTEQMMYPSKYFDGNDEPVPLVALPETLPKELENYVVVEENVFGALLWRIFLDDYMDRGDANRIARGWGGDRYSVLEERLPSDPLRREGEPTAGPAHDETPSDGAPSDEAPSDEAPKKDTPSGEPASETEVSPTDPEGDVVNRRSTILWRTQWDTVKDADEFFRGYATVLLGKYPGRTVVLHEDARAFVVEVSTSKDTAPSPGVRTHFFERSGVFLQGMRVVIVEGAAPERFDEIVSYTWDQNKVDESVLFERDRGEGIYAAPAAPTSTEPERPFARPPSMVLAERANLPHHRAVFRFGFGAQFDGTDLTSPRLVPDRELRWGFRQHLEWAPPFIFSLDITSAAFGIDRNRAFQTVVTGGMLGLGFGLASDTDLAFYVAPAFAVTQRMGMRGLSVVLQLRTVGDFYTTTEVEQRASADAAAAVYVAPFAFAPRGVPVLGDDPGRLVLSFGAGATENLVDIGRTLSGKGATPEVSRITLGAVTTRGFFRQPTIELRILDGVFVYETSLIDLDPATLALLRHEHTAGVLVRF